MINKDLVQKLAEKKLEGTDKFLVEVSVNKGNKISVFLDSDSSLSIEDCISVSRHIESTLDRETEDFELNVSSAGLDHPFKLIRQYRKYQGKEVEVLKTEGNKLIGLLIEVNTDGILIEIPANKKKKTDKQQISLLFENIKETKGIISFKK